MPIKQIEVDQDLKRIIMPDEDWSARHALSVVTADFNAAQTYRTNNHDWRWDRADRRYFGVVPIKTWEGTNIERSHISVMTAWDQVEALIPPVMQAIFGDDPWFEATAMGATSSDAARECHEILAAQLYQSHVRKVIKLALRSALIYGNGVLESCWYYSSTQKKKFRVTHDPVMSMQDDPLSGLTLPRPTGKMSRRVIEEMQEEIENRPLLKVIPITQFYIDPNCPTTNPEDAQYTMTRTFEPISTLIGWREDEEAGYDIPDDGELLEWAKDKHGAQGDMTQMNREAARDGTWNPAVDQSADPAAKRVEVIRYKTNHRNVFVVNQKYVIYNKTNEYGKKMQYSPFYTELIDRFYGMALTDIVDGEQLLQEGLINSHLDEISLALHPHTKVKNHRNLSAYQLRVRPGGVSYHEDPKNDMIREFPSGITADADAAVAASDMRVQKKTGLTDIATLGLSSGPNPGARSATGAGIQGRATAARIQSIVENLTDEVLEPILHDFHTLDRHHLDPEQKIVGINGQQIDPIELFSAEVRYSSRAASRIQSRIALQQFVPFIVQYVMNPALMQELSAQGKTVDFEEIFQMFIDASGYGRKATWIRPMNEQEKKAMQERQAQSDEMIKLQAMRERMETMEQMASDKGVVDVTKESIKGSAHIEAAKIGIHKSVVEHALGERESKSDSKKSK